MCGEVNVTTDPLLVPPLGLHVLQFGLLSLPLTAHLLNVPLQLSIHCGRLLQLVRQQSVHLVQTQRPTTPKKPHHKLTHRGAK